MKRWSERTQLELRLGYIFRYRQNARFFQCSYFYPSVTMAILLNALAKIAKHSQSSTVSCLKGRKQWTYSFARWDCECVWVWNPYNNSQRNSNEQQPYHRRVEKREKRRTLWNDVAMDIYHILDMFSESFVAIWIREWTIKTDQHAFLWTYYT